MAEGLPKRLPKWLLFFAVLVSFGLAAPAQKAATITFTLDFPGSIPDHYSITVDSSGHASYISGGKRNADSDSDDFHYDFTISDWNRARIFDLASRARYFAGDINYAKRVASTGTKTLSYKDDERSTHTTYNYTTNQPVQHLTTIFQNISTTLEFALDEELKRMEEAAQQSSLEEIQAVAPILKQILADSSVINVTRARAEHLLAKTGTGSH